DLGAAAGLSSSRLLLRDALLQGAPGLFRLVDQTGRVLRGVHGGVDFLLRHCAAGMAAAGGGLEPAVGRDAATPRRKPSGSSSTRFRLPSPRTICGLTPPRAWVTFLEPPPRFSFLRSP